VQGSEGEEERGSRGAGVQGKIEDEEWRQKGTGSGERNVRCKKDGDMR